MAVSELVSPGCAWMGNSPGSKISKQIMDLMYAYIPLQNQLIWTVTEQNNPITAQRSKADMQMITAGVLEE